MDALRLFLNDRGDLTIEGDDWTSLNERFSQEELTHAIVELKLQGVLNMPKPVTTLDDALLDFANLKQLYGLQGFNTNSSFDTKYDVPLEQQLGVLLGTTLGTAASDFFHFDLRSRVGDYHRNKGIAVRWDRMTHGDANFLSAIWSLKLKKLTRQTLLSALRMRLILVPQFRPAAAKALYTLYGGGDVLDFCGGWGDRLAGAAACFPLVRSMTLVEPRPEAAERYNQQLTHYGVSMPLTVHTACAEDILPQLPSNSFNIVFTSPPYFDCEHYGDVTATPELQSHRKFRQFEAWCQGFLFPVVTESIRLLRGGGVLALNVNDVMRRGTRHHICTNLLQHVAQSQQMQYVGVWGYSMAQRMGRNLGSQRSSTSSLSRAEPVYVWRKI